MSDKFYEEISLKENQLEQELDFNSLDTTQAIQADIATSLGIIAKSLFELNESVKFLVEEIKKEKKNDT